MPAAANRRPGVPPGADRRACAFASGPGSPRLPRCRRAPTEHGGHERGVLVIRSIEGKVLFVSRAWCLSVPASGSVYVNVSNLSPERAFINAPAALLRGTSVVTCLSSPIVSSRSPIVECRPEIEIAPSVSSAKKSGLQIGLGHRLPHGDFHARVTGHIGIDRKLGVGRGTKQEDRLQQRRLAGIVAPGNKVDATQPVDFEVFEASEVANAAVVRAWAGIRVQGGS